MCCDVAPAGPIRLSLFVRVDVCMPGRFECTLLSSFKDMLCASSVLLSVLWLCCQCNTARRDDLCGKITRAREGQSAIYLHWALQ